jgi:hypothetical protein
MSAISWRPILVVEEAGECYISKECTHIVYLSIPFNVSYHHHSYQDQDAAIM